MSGQFPFYYNYEFSKKALVIAHLVAAEHHTGIAEVMEFESHWSFRIFSGLYLYDNCLKLLDNCEDPFHLCHEFCCPF